MEPKPKNEPAIYEQLALSTEEYTAKLAEAPVFAKKAEVNATVAQGGEVVQTLLADGTVRQLTLQMLVMQSSLIQAVNSILFLPRHLTSVMRQQLKMAYSVQKIWHEVSRTIRVHLLRLWHRGANLSMVTKTV